MTNGDRILDPDELFLSCFEESTVRKRSPPSVPAAAACLNNNGDKSEPLDIGTSPSRTPQRVRKTVSLVNRDHDATKISEEIVRKLQLV